MKLAVVEARAEQQDMRRRQEEWIQSILQPVSERLEEELVLISKDLDLIGAWDVQRNTSDGMGVTSQYVFIDADTVRIPTPDDASKSMLVWYSISPGSIVVSDKPSPEHVEWRSISRHYQTPYFPFLRRDAESLR